MFLEIEQHRPLLLDPPECPFTTQPEVLSIPLDGKLLDTKVSEVY
jgi:hypothetical protein